MQMQTIRMAVHWLSTQLLEKQGWYHPGAGYPRLPALTPCVLVPLLYSGLRNSPYLCLEFWVMWTSCMSFREFYVIIRLIPTGVFLLSLRGVSSMWSIRLIRTGVVFLSLRGRWQPGSDCLPNRESPGKVHWEKDPGPASWGFNFANPNGGVRRWGKTRCIYQFSETGSEADEPFLTGKQDCRPNNNSF